MRWKSGALGLGVGVGEAARWLQEQLGAKPDSALVKSNRKYAVVQIGGKMRIAYFEPSPVFKGVDTIVYSDRATSSVCASASGCQW